MSNIRQSTNWVFIISIISGFICLKYWYEGICDYNFSLIPFGFSLMAIIIGKYFGYFLRLPGFTIVTIICLMRYDILPILLSSSGSLGIYRNNYFFINEAIALMIYEMACSLIFIRLIYSSASLSIGYHTTKLSFEPHKHIYALVGLSLCVIAYVYRHKIINGFALITVGFIDDSLLGDKMPVFVNLYWQSTLMWFYSYSILKIAASSKSSKKKVIRAIIYTLLFLLATYIVQDRISRWNTLICATASYFLLVKCFPKQSKQIKLLVVVPVCVLMVSATLLKNFAEVSISGNSSMASTTEAYLSGPTNVNNAIGLDETGKVGLHNIGYDLLNNMPIVNNYIDRDNSLPYQYNLYIGRVFSDEAQGDQIIPLIGESYIYFGIILSPLLTVFFYCLTYLFDREYVKSEGYSSFLYALIAAWCAVAPALNLIINISWWWIRILPLMLLIYVVNNIFKTRKRVIG